MSDAAISYQSEFWLEHPTSGVLTELGEVKRIQLPVGGQFDTADVTHLKSPDRRRESVNTMRSDARFEVELNRVPGSITDEIIQLAEKTKRPLAARIGEADGTRIIAWHDFDIQSVQFETSDLELEEPKTTTFSYGVASSLVTTFLMTVTGSAPAAKAGTAYSFLPDIRHADGAVTVTAEGFDPTDYGMTLNSSTGALTATTVVRYTPAIEAALKFVDSATPTPTTAILPVLITIATA